ncbi:MAG TPA: hypothetical protein VFY93_01520 [Planctomycetota bacterium]|nr:hypothetical protein [Planctomycetota bacterium]
MRRLVLLLLVAPVLAQEGGEVGGQAGGAGDDAAASERLRMARLAFDARLKLADLLRTEGKAKEALAAYARAAAIFEASLGAAAAGQAAAGGGGQAVAFGGRGARHPAADANAAERGLRWLAAHQDAESGGWDADGFMKHDPKEDPCDGKGAKDADLRVTALATLAFLGAGYTDRGAAATNPYAANVRAAVAFLLAAQKDDGAFGSGSLRDDAIATVALSEAFAITRNPRYRLPAERGVAALARQQAAGAAWKDDPSLTAWCVCAIASARGAGLAAPEGALRDALTWAGTATDAATGRVGKEGRTERATAAVLLTRMLCGQGPRAAGAIPKGLALCVAKPPLWNAEEGTVDPEYWWFGTHALWRAGGADWQAWSGAMGAAIVNRQQAAGSRAGSWDPVGVEGGRVEATALLTLTLEPYYRYADAMGVR